MISGLVDSIWLSLSTALSVVIPYLYLIFEKLASVEILSQEEISRIWNNLYVLLSVLILFAIAIKLINAIVNPDVLTDNKKGVRKSFFSAFIAIFLVALLPIGFRLLHEIQNEIVNENIIQRYVFQNNDDNPSGELVWVAISSCIDLGSMEDVIDPASLGLEETSTGIWMPVEPEPWSASAFLGILAQARPWVALATRVTGTTALVENAFEFHPFILFIFLLVLTYELVVLVLDTALRAFKLLLLELMTPIILGAYVFKSDILKNWALEYIKTFLQVFLLIFAINLMEYIIPVATSIADNNSGFLFRGIIRMLLYIGVLRLIKQIFPLINKIFGTNIQGKGGIKGRLGEMAAVGGLAQKAWGALGTGVKNIGKLGLSLPAAGVGYAANSIYNNQTGRRLQDHNAVRGVKSGLSGISTALKTGDWGKARDAYRNSFNNTKATPQEINSRSQYVDDKIDRIINAGGKNAITDPDIRNKNRAKRDAEREIINIVGENSNIDLANKEHQRKLQAKSLVDSINDDNAAIDSIMTKRAEAIQNSDPKKATAISEALNSFNNAKRSEDGIKDLEKFIEDHSDHFDQTTIDSLIGDDGKLHTKGRKIQIARDFKDALGFSDADLVNINGSNAALKFFGNNTLKGRLEDDKSLEKAIDAANLPELDKMELQKWISTQEALNNSMAFAYGKSSSYNAFRGAEPSMLQAIKNDVQAPIDSAGNIGTTSNNQNQTINNNTTVVNNNNNNNNSTNNTTNTNNTNNSSNESNNDNRRSNTDSNTATRVEVSNIDDINSTIKDAASDITNSMNMVSDSVNRSETRQRSRQEELLDAMGGHGMRSEEEIRNENENE